MRNPLFRRFVRPCLAAFVLSSGAALAQGLPPAVEADRQLQLASSEMDKADKGGQADWAKAAAALKAAEATGVRMPANIDYHQGRALLATGDHDGSLKRLERYLRVQGNQAKYYSHALQLYTQAQSAQQAAQAAAREKAALDAAWVRVKSTWWSVDELDDGCDRAQSRIRRYAPSARGFDCSCETDYLTHPAWLDHQEVRCTVSWQGNLLEEKRQSFYGKRDYRIHRNSGSVLEGLRSEDE